jgi:hypothetical protein
MANVWILSGIVVVYVLVVILARLWARCSGLEKQVHETNQYIIKEISEISWRHRDVPPPRLDITHVYDLIKSSSVFTNKGELVTEYWVQGAEILDYPVEIYVNFRPLPSHMYLTGVEELKSDYIKATLREGRNKIFLYPIFSEIEDEEKAVSVIDGIKELVFGELSDKVEILRD